MGEGHSKLKWEETSSIENILKCVLVLTLPVYDV